jgi:iron-sulfur cluster assembly accessory protein
MPITITDQALEQLIANGLGEDNFLRLVIQPGGCAGMSYDAYIDTDLTNRDEVIFEQGVVRIVSETLFMHMLDGLNIDFSEDLIQPGFILKNPNAQQSCGCGASFQVGGTDPGTTREGCG